MYAGVDIGGTKTLVAALDDAGAIAERIKFATPRAYPEFLHDLGRAAGGLSVHDFRAGGIAVPGKVDRARGIGEHFGNLPWRNVPLQRDAETIFHCPVLLENDANLGGLSEAMLLPADQRVLYVTISTGIGTGFIDHHQIAPELEDSEGGQMVLAYHNRRTTWEDFASGRAIVKRFGKPASDITDAATWQRIAHDLAAGFIELIAIMQPDVIVIGGSVGAYFSRFKPFLTEELKRYHNPLLTTPLLQEAARPDDAVVYGCYDLAHGRYGTAA